MQTLGVISGGIFRHSNHVDRAVRTARSVDHWSCGNTDFWHYLVTISPVTRGLALAQQRYLPENRACISIEGENAVVLGCDIQNIVKPTAWDRHVEKVERLGINFAVHGVEPDLAEICGIHIFKSENCFMQILSSACVVVVIGQYISLDWSLYG